MHITKPLKYLSYILLILVAFVSGASAVKNQHFPYKYMSKFHSAVFSPSTSDNPPNAATKNVTDKISDQCNVDIHVIWGENPSHARLIRTENLNVLLGCGTNYNRASPVVSYLNELNINKIDYLVITMYDEDHVGGFTDVLDNFRVNRIILEKTVSDETRKQNKRAVKEEARSNGIEITYPNIGDKLEVGEDVSLKKISPAKTYKKSNTHLDKPDRCNSTVYRLSSQNIDGLLMSDAQMPAEREIMSRDVNISSDFIIVGHHGIGPINSFDFLDRVNPDIAIIDSAYWNRKVDGQIESQSKLQYVSDIETYVTNVDGSVVIQEYNDSYNIETSLST